MEKDIPTNDYAAKFLADLEAQYVALGNVIASLRAARSVGALGGMPVPGEAALGVPPPGGLSSVPSGSTLPRGAFLGKTATDAITLYLGAVRAKKTNREIGQALKDGGLESTGNFDNLINGALFQLKNKGVVLRFDDGWGLAEWYPESFRTRVAEKTDTSKRKVKKKKTARKARGPKAPEGPAVGLQYRIDALLRAQPTRVFPAQEIAQALDVNLGALNLTLGKMLKAGKVQKWQGGYQAPEDNIQQMPKAV